GCQYMEGISIFGDTSINEGKVLEIIAKHSPKNFHEIKLYRPKSYLKDHLESFLISWKNRESKKSISLIVIKDEYDTLGIHEGSMIIEKYKNLGVIKKFEIRIL